MNELLNDVVLDANVYLIKLDLIQRTILRSLRKGHFDGNPTEVRQSLIDVLEFCGRPISEIELANDILINLIDDPKNLEDEDIQSLMDLINRCKLDLESFIEHHTPADFISSVISHEEYKRYLVDLEDFLGIHTIDLKSKILEIIYKYPGNFISAIHKYITKNIVKVSYTTVWNYINNLEAEDQILTIGGPQGNLRYCFPNPRKIRDRKEYYGKYFGIKGVIKEKITEYFTSQLKSSSFYDFYIVNSEVVPEIILAVGYAAPIRLGARIEIKAYGLINSVEYLKDQEGYIPEIDVDDLDVLFGWRVTLADNEKKVLWADKHREVLKQTIPI